MVKMRVEIASIEQTVWSGNALFIFTRTIIGEIGILPYHTHLMAKLVNNTVTKVKCENEDTLQITTYNGLLKVANNVVLILAEKTEIK